MKNLSKFLLIILCVFVAGGNITVSSINNCKAYKTESITYAKANKNCLFFRSQTMSENIGNLWFEIPETYFVSILSQVSDTIFKVQYDGYVGYVFASSVSVVSFLPTSPTLENITFDIKQNVGTQIWSAPSDSIGRVLTTISADTKQVNYIASIFGEIPIGGTSNVWYYARWTPASSSTSVYEGYVYSESTTNLSHIANNLEYEPEPTANNIQTPISLNNTAQIIMIILIVLPFLVLLVMTILKIVRHYSQKKAAKQVEQKSETIPQFVRKVKKPTENSDEFEVVFPEYDYIDDDDLL